MGVFLASRQHRKGIYSLQGQNKLQDSPLSGCSSIGSADSLRRYQLFLKRREQLQLTTVLRWSNWSVFLNPFSPRSPSPATSKWRVPASQPNANSVFKETAQTIFVKPFTIWKSADHEGSLLLIVTSTRLFKVLLLMWTNSFTKGKDECWFPEP